jgi:hypothetical protein
MNNNIDIEINAPGGCLTKLTFDKNQYDNNNKFTIECRYLMTSITFTIKKDIDDLSNTKLINNIKLLNNINIYIANKENYNKAWNILGYSGIMHINWLNNCLFKIKELINLDTNQEILNNESYTIIDNNLNNILRYVFNHGTITIYNVLFNE